MNEPKTEEQPNLEDYLGPEPRAGHDDPETSHAAAAKITANRTKHQVLSILSLPNYADGLATYELADIFGNRRDSVSPVMKPLETVDLVRRIGTKVNPATNCENYIWQLRRPEWEAHSISKKPLALGFSSFQEIHDRKPTRYTAGLAMKGSSYVALVRKLRPEDQKNHLNAIGGKVGFGETADECMVREFAEEAPGLAGTVEAWRLFCVLSGIGDDGKLWEVNFYRGDLTSEWRQHINFGPRIDPANPPEKGREPEEVEVYPVDRLNSDGNRLLTMPNIPWLISLALAHRNLGHKILYAHQVQKTEEI